MHTGTRLICLLSGTAVGIVALSSMAGVAPTAEPEGEIRRSVVKRAHTERPDRENRPAESPRGDRHDADDGCRLPAGIG